MIDIKDNEHLEKTIKFITEVDKLKGVMRKIRPLGITDRYENSAEHSWQIALFALSFQRFDNYGIDINRVIGMLLIHDIGEIDIGDTMVFVEEGWEDRKASELEAITRIFGMLDNEVASEFISLWKEFEEGESKDAQFANALDRAMPVLLNLENNGQSWRDNGISYERVVNRVKLPISKGFTVLWDYLEIRLKEARAKGYFGA